MLSSFAICLIVIAGGAIIGCLAWVINLHVRAARHGLPRPTFLSYFRPPSQNPVYQATANRGGPRIRSSSGGKGFLGLFKKKNSGRGDFGPLADDSAWDSRGYSNYYEEDAELGLRVDTSHQNSSRHNAGGDERSGRQGGRDQWTPEDDSPPRGRSRSRSPNPGYNVAGKRGPVNGGKRDPFGDDNKVRKSTDTGRSSVFTEEPL